LRQPLTTARTFGNTKEFRQDFTEFSDRITNSLLAAHRSWGIGRQRAMGRRSKATCKPQRTVKSQRSFVEFLFYVIYFLFIKHNMAAEYRVSADELASIEAVFHRSNMTGTQTPLQATIMISPLMLLLPINLLALRWTKKKLLDVSICAAC
jgi:hypothetical protein